MRHLSVLVEWVHQNKVYSVLLQVTCALSFSCGQKGEVGAALNSKTFWIESKILKLVELEEAQEFFIWLEVENVVFLLLNLESVLKNNL